MSIPECQPGQFFAACFQISVVERRQDLGCPCTISSFSGLRSACVGRGTGAHGARCALSVFAKVVSAQSDHPLHLFCACLSLTQPQREDACAVVYPKASHIIWYPSFKERVWGSMQGHFLREPEWMPSSLIMDLSSNF